MSDGELEEARNLWNRVADDWKIQVGDDGDSNRRLNSDPVLWTFAGDVRGLAVLDAGCGTGYLSRKLRDHGARVTGIDFSERMIMLARAQHPAMEAFNRVLKAGGVTVLVFSHPCFPQGRAIASDSGDTITYTWGFPYFAPRKCTDPPWAHFTSTFIWFHRPLSDYWKAFTASGFRVAELEEPRRRPKGLIFHAGLPARTPWTTSPWKGSVPQGRVNGGWSQLDCWSAKRSCSASGSDVGVVWTADVLIFGGTPHHPTPRSCR